MNCPVCDAHLRTIEKHGVEVDICPDCKGIWLDRGELEKILNMSASNGPSLAPHREERKEHEREYELRGDHDNKRGNHKRRGSWLSDILEGFGGD